MATRTLPGYDVWYTEADHLTRVANVPGHAPKDWFNFKYTPAPAELLLIQHSVPRGSFSDINFLHPVDFSPRKSIVMSQNEIEAALVQSDLSRHAVNHAMGLLPNLSLFYSYLEQKNAVQAVDQIRRLLA
jgi:hypothetical protein